MESPTAVLRAWWIAYLGGRWDSRKRTLREAASEAGVGFNTLARFVRGRSIESDTFDALAIFAGLVLQPGPEE